MPEQTPAIIRLLLLKSFFPFFFVLTMLDLPANMKYNNAPIIQKNNITINQRILSAGFRSETKQLIKAQIQKIKRNRIIKSTKTIIPIGKNNNENTILTQIILKLYF